MKKNLTLSELKVKSFETESNINIKGGTGTTAMTVRNTFNFLCQITKAPLCYSQEK